MGKRGQDVPVVVRELASKTGPRYEIIVGRRRWAAAKLIPRFSLIADVVQMDDAEAASLMNSENMDKADISDFERAISYSRLLAGHVFDSQEALLKAMPTTTRNLSQAKLSRMLTAAEISEYDWMKPRLKGLRKVALSTAYSIAQILKDPSARKVAKAFSTDQENSELNTAGFLKALLKKLKPIAERGGGQEFLNSKGNPMFTVEITAEKMNISVNRQGAVEGGQREWRSACEKLYTLARGAGGGDKPVKP